MLNKWYLAHLEKKLRSDPGFRWNIFSETLGMYVFAEDCSEGQYSVELPDGIYRLDLFQTKATAAKFSEYDIDSKLNIAASTIPSRKARTHDKYGDYREFLSISASIVEAVHDYCYSEDVPLKPDGTEDMECRAFFDRSFQVQAMSSYGLSGSVTRKEGDSPPIQIVSVPFCSVFPNGSSGLGKMQRQWEGIELVQVWDNAGCESNYKILRDSKIQCDSISRPRSNRVLVHQSDGSHDSTMENRNSVRSTQFQRMILVSDLRTSMEDGNASNSLLHVRLQGPSAITAGPGYKNGFFWVELQVDWQSNSSARPMFLYSLNRPVQSCSSNNSEYLGPTYISDITVASIHVLACFESKIVASENITGFNIVKGPQLDVEVAVQDDHDVQVALCSVLSITGFCFERTALIGHVGRSATFRILAASNAELGAWENSLSRIQKLHFGNAIKDYFEILKFKVNVPVSPNELHHIGEFCSSHYDCAPIAPERIGMKVNETLQDDLVWGNAFCASYGSRFSKGPTCDYCNLKCFDPSDSYDGFCPEHCGLDPSQGLPSCVSASLLEETFSCQDKFKFELHQFTEKNETIGDFRMQKANKLRTVTPFNYLIGGVIITQHRVLIGECNTSSETMGNFIRKHGVRCADSSRVDSHPFGVDPMFVVGSAMFNGKHLPEEFYNLSTEVFVAGQLGTPTQTPYGFFPHQWDAATGQVKNESFIWKPSIDEFKLYFDGRLSHDQAQKLLSAMELGRFFDKSTSMVEVEMITFNVDVQLLALWTFVFHWRQTGDIEWNYALQVVNINQDHTFLYALLCAMALALFVLHMVFELMEFFNNVVRMQAFKSFWFDIVNWIHLIVQGYSWYFWFEIRSQVSSFKLDNSSYVLKDPMNSARLFETNPIAEFELLELTGNISDLAEFQCSYASYAFISIMLLVVKLIVSLDFLPKLGLITRTLSKAGSNMLHFLILYALVLIGYSIVGNLMFGSVYTGMASLTDTIQTLMFFTLAFDPTRFFAPMTHSIAHRQGSDVQQGYLEYNLFMWSFTFVNIFILMGIFLALIVSNYDNVARQSEGARSFLHDLKEIMVYYLKYSFLPATHFVNEDDFLIVIEKALQELKNVADFKKNASVLKIRDALTPKGVILLGRGMGIESKHLKILVDKVVARSSTRRSFFSFFLQAVFENETPRIQVAPDRAVDTVDIGMQDSPNEAAVEDLFSRLSTKLTGMERCISQELSKHLRIENQKLIFDLNALLEVLDQRSRQAINVLESLVCHSGPNTQDINGAKNDVLFWLPRT